MIEEQNESENGIETADSNTENYEVESADSEVESAVNLDEVAADEERQALIDESAEAPILNEAADSDKGDAEQAESLGEFASASDSDIEVHAAIEDSDSIGPVDGSDEEESEVVIYDADAEDAEEERQRLAALAPESEEAVEIENTDNAEQPPAVRGMAELMGIVEALIFVSDEPLTAKSIAELLKEEKGWVQTAVEALAQEFNERNGGLQIREVAGGWQIATRPEHHEYVRAFLKSRPSAKLSLASLETLAVIAYKQPINVPEILEIRGVHSSSAIKTLLDKRLIVAKGRKETVGRPMMYGTSKEFLLQFGLKDLSELPNVEDFEDLAAGTS
jgi:segregation and condensation protein B